MATQNPGILNQIKGTGNAVLDALKANYASGPQSAPLTPGPGSVLDQRDQQITPLLPPQQPLMPQHLVAPQPDLAQAQGPYGSGPGEKRIDVSEYQKPLGGLSGIKRK